MKAHTAGHKSERGNATVEMALGLLLFLMLVFGVIDFSRIVFAFNTVSHAAREATRYASVRGRASGHPASAADVQRAAQTQAVGMERSALQVTTSWTPDNNAGSVVRVQVRYNFRPLLPFIPASIIPLGSISQMVIAQ